MSGVSRCGDYAAVLVGGSVIGGVAYVVSRKAIGLSPALSTGIGASIPALLMLGTMLTTPSPFETPEQAAEALQRRLAEYNLGGRYRAEDQVGGLGASWLPADAEERDRVHIEGHLLTPEAFAPFIWEHLVKSLGSAQAAACHILKAGGLILRQEAEKAGDTRPQYSVHSRGESLYLTHQDPKDSFIIIPYSKIRTTPIPQLMREVKEAYTASLQRT